MEQSEQQKRLEAEQKFQAALEQLEDILQENPTEEETPNTSTEDVSEAELVDDGFDIDLAALEDAVADIEHFLEERTKSQ
ncbi:hypothetical protein [Nostoc sp. MS1]|uniref:hypothetical protein n=1 Tax=Nostoc sp. MS1 TaxID=2764711 RepID=UPI001CC3A2B6|nr:hypothetical protein [Nostoc sp. MS1]BCL36891.1 hypothetical protein NSMS1_33380 [Nostoc sp. MS1]